MKIRIIALFALLTIFTVVFALNSLAADEIDGAKEKINSITKGVYGEVKYVDKQQTDLKEGKKLDIIKLKDNDYQYGVFADTLDIATVNPMRDKKESIRKDNGDISKSDALLKAKEYRDKYKLTNNKIKSYVDENYYNRKDDIYDVHIFNFYAISYNSIKTGDIVTVWVSNKGDMYRFEQIKGNADVASSSKPAFSPEQALNIAIKDLKNRDTSAEQALINKDMSNSKVELIVYDNRVVYFVDLKDVYKNHYEGFNSYFYIIDATSGEVVNMIPTK